MRTSRTQRLAERKRRIAGRLRERAWRDQPRPMFAGSNIHYDVADRDRGLGVGGIGAMHLLARRTGLIDRLDAQLHLLKRHLPYHESDHVLNVAYNILSGGTCLDDLELRRNDEVYWDALGAQRIPDPTTAGDFCRRFTHDDVESLMDAINETRVGVWRRQPETFFDEAVIDMDGSLAPTYGQCKEGMGLSYDGQWGYHPLIISLANTQEPLYLVNRSGNRPSHEKAWMYVDGAIELCRRAGFRKVLLRGDTDFTQTVRLDEWNAQGVRFVFGIDAMANLTAIADELPKAVWERLNRARPYAVKTRPRGRRANVKERIVVAIALPLSLNSNLPTKFDMGCEYPIAFHWSGGLHGTSQGPAARPTIGACPEWHVTNGKSGFWHRIGPSFRISKRGPPVELSLPYMPFGTVPLYCAAI